MSTQNQTYCPECGQPECTHFCTYCGGPWKFCLGQHYVPQQQYTNQPPPFIQGAKDTVNYLGESVAFFLLPIMGVVAVIAAFVAPIGDPEGGGLSLGGHFWVFVFGVAVLTGWWIGFMRPIVRAHGWDKRK